MFSILIAAAMASQSEPAVNIGEDVPPPDIVKDLAAPPVFEREKPVDCGCEEAAPALAYLEGFVVDAELTLGADGRSINDRQATIFDVLQGQDIVAMNVRGRTKIFHSANRKQCGVTFDYGKKYRVPVRKTEDGKFETDLCLVSGKAGKPAPKAGSEPTEKNDKPKSE